MSGDKLEGRIAPITKDESMAYELMIQELNEAKKKFPGFPDDAVHAAAIVAEEAGELTKASLDFHYLRETSREYMREEAAQTAAMAIRFLIHLDEYGTEDDKD